MQAFLKDTYTGPMRIAHRGVVQAAPENTLGAFEAAAEAGLEGIEIDVRMSKDGEIVLVHDANLTRMTLGLSEGFRNDLIAEMDWETLSQIDLPYANHLLDDETPRGVEYEQLAILPMRLMGQEKDYRQALAEDGRMAKFMRFNEFMDWLDETPGMTAEIEVKAAGAAPKILDILDGRASASRCILFSGTEQYINEMQKTCALSGKPQGLRLGANIRELTDKAKAEIAGMDLYEVGMNAGKISPADVQWLADREIYVFSNLGDYPAWWEQMCALGIKGFKTNYAKAFSLWWQARQSK